MQAIRIHPAPSNSMPFSPSNPAPSSSLSSDKIPIPTPKSPKELLIRIKATTIIRDMLTWPESYRRPYTIPGHDFSGIVAAVFEGDSIASTDSTDHFPASSISTPFKVGDEVFGMVNADCASTWAEYALVSVDEVARKPRGLGWENAAALPLSAQTAYEALFEHAGIPVPRFNEKGSLGSSSPSSAKRVLITGAAGGVGIFLVQLSAHAGMRVVASSNSNARNEEFLHDLGADEVLEYESLEGEKDGFDVIVDCVGGDVLAKCWGYVKREGVLLSVDSSSFNFVKEHEKIRLSNGKEDVKALFFIVHGSGENLHALADLADRGTLRSFVAASFPIDKVREAYDYGNGRFTGRGKVVLTI